MRRTLALCAAAAILRAAPAAADPMDLVLQRFGAPSAAVWTNLGAAPGTEAQLASDSIARYRTAVLQLGLGLTSFALEPPLTNGPVGFEVGLEWAGTQIRHAKGAVATGAAGLPEVSAWPTRGDDGQSLGLAAVHVRKALPYSFELGGRGIYVNQSQMAAVQGEIRWAVNEEWWYLPDAAFRLAYTHLFGQRDLDLDVVDFDSTLGKRIGLAGAMRITPYAALRLTQVAARSQPIEFGSYGYPDARTAPGSLATVAAFPAMRFRDNSLVRWTLGLDVEASAFSMGVEGTLQGAKSFSSRGALSAARLPSSLTYAFHLGFNY